MPKPMNCPMIAELLPRLLTYEPVSGHLTWIRRDGETKGDKIFNTKRAGTRAGATANNDRYRRIGINISGRKYLMLEHRIAWLLHYGAWPTNDVDHVNHDGHDNRIDNLRDVDKKNNSRNMKLSSRNKSGFTGVFWCEPMKSWRASYCRVMVGYYASREAAAAAVKSARASAGFHGNHGQ